MPHAHDTPILVRLSEGKDDVLELVHDVSRRMVHQFEGSFVIRLGEVVILCQS